MIKLVLLCVTLTLSFGIAAANLETTSPEPSAQTYYENAKKSLEKNNWRNALMSLRQAAALEPSNADIQTLLGTTYRMAGNMDKAFEAYHAALQLDPNNLAAHESLGQTFLAGRDLSNAEKELKTLNKLCGKSCEHSISLSKSIAEYKAETKLKADIKAEALSESKAEPKTEPKTR